MDPHAEGAQFAERADDGAGLGEAAGFEHDAAEGRQVLCGAGGNQGFDGIEQVIGDGTADAAVGEHRHRQVPGVCGDDGAVDVDFAGFVDDDGGVGGLGVAEEAGQEGGFAAAEEAGEENEVSHERGNSFIEKNMPTSLTPAPSSRRHPAIAAYRTRARP